ncbi:MAG: hypothetical protein AAF403_06125 [Pseudomonadota bacterium]
MDWAKEFDRIELEQFKQNRKPIELSKLYEKFGDVIREDIAYNKEHNIKYYPFEIVNQGKNKSKIRLPQSKYFCRCSDNLSKHLREHSLLNNKMDDSPLAEQTSQEFLEGERKQKEISFFVRNPKLAQAAKKQHGYKCQACGFNPEQKYGQAATSCIECHHENPLSERDETEWDQKIKTNIKDAKILCANCHRIIHSKSPALTFNQLLESIKRSNC